MNDDKKRTIPPDEQSTAEVGRHAGPTPSVPDRIGRYKILGALGKGGMGVVYEAEQSHPRRRVALKVIRGGAFVDEARLRLFQREADALARLQHPNIAAIYESGRTENGQHFFAMELVRGETLLHYLRGRPKVVSSDELRHRLLLFRQIAGAMHYAHQRGVIHRDLKPSNIIITEETTSQSLSISAAPLATVKVLDFGLARITEGDMAASMTTEVGAIKGTLPYMSPEQARGVPEAIDIRTDVYALGVVLYEMLTGRLPYNVMKGGVPEALRVICEEVPQPLSQTWNGTRRLDPDVETIIGKALEKDAERRYQSAAELAADIDRYLASQPILARPPSTFYHLRKFALRNRVLIGGVIATFLVLVAGLIMSEMQRREALVQRQASEASRLLLLGEKEIETDSTRAIAYATASLERADNAHTRRFALNVLWRGPIYFRVPSHDDASGNAAARFSPDGEWLAIWHSGSGKTALWRPGGDPPRFVGPPNPYIGHFPGTMLFAPDSKTIFTTGGAGGAIREWSIADGKLIRSFVYDGLKRGRPEPLQVSSDKSRMISRVWEEDGLILRFHLLSWLRESERPVVLGTFLSNDLSVAIASPVVDSTGSFAAYGLGGVLYVRSLEGATWGPARAVGGREGEEFQVRLAADHQWKYLTVVNSVDSAWQFRIWSLDPSAPGLLHVFDYEGNFVRDITFDPDGSTLASAHEGGDVNLWSLDAPASIPPLGLPLHEQELSTSVDFHPNGRWLAVTPGAVVWPLVRTYPRVLLREDRGTEHWFRGFSFSPDGTWVAAVLLGALRRLPLTRSAGEDIATLTNDIPTGQVVVFDPAGRYVLVGTDIGPYFMPLPGGEPRLLPGFEEYVLSVAVSRDGRLIALGGGFPHEELDRGHEIENDEFIRIWDTETWDHRDLQVGDVIAGIEFTADDQVIFAAGENLYRWNLIDPAPKVLAAGDTWLGHRVGRIDLSPDGRYVLNHRGIYDLETNIARPLETHQPAYHAVFDPTGTIVVSGGRDGIIRVGPATGEEPHWLVGHEGMVNEVAASPDGQWILSAGADGTLRLWPMPDLDKPPLHALPHEEFLERLKAQTNLRAVPDPGSPTGYRITWDNPSFKSWDDVPTWYPPE